MKVSQKEINAVLNALQQFEEIGVCETRQDYIRIMSFFRDLIDKRVNNCKEYLALDIEY
jgi:hypothetical protein